MKIHILTNLKNETLYTELFYKYYHRRPLYNFIRFFTYLRAPQILRKCNAMFPANRKST